MPLSPLVKQGNRQKAQIIFCLLAAKESQEMLIAHIAHWLSLNRPTAVHARLTALSENAAQLVHCTLRRNIQDIQDILDTLNIQHPLWQCNPTFKSLHFMHTYAPGILCKLLIKTDIFCPQSKGTSSPIVTKYLVTTSCVYFHLPKDIF